MCTIKATLQADADGTLHLPLPPELRQGKVLVTATVERAGIAPPAGGNLKGFGSLRGKLALADDFDAPLEDFKEYSE
ncbi:MAG TPA: DUF2281 domain-containing protein [Tepidisphaeraceae bacterium]|jgi:hypothetical protein